MSYTIYRHTASEGKAVVTCVDDEAEVGAEIMADLEKRDDEPVYTVEHDGEAREIVPSFLAQARRMEIDHGLPLIRHDGQDGDI